MTTKVKPDDPAWLKAAFSKLGLKEISGPRHERQIIAMYEACGHNVTNDETAWCAAFVGWCLREAGLPNTRSLMARSYVKYGRKLDHRRIVPRGSIAVWPRGKPPSGHVNFVLSDNGTTLTCIGGNQSMKGTSGAVTISRAEKANLVAVVMPEAPPIPEASPPDIEPPSEPSGQPEAHTPWWKRLWLRWTGGAGGVGLLTYMTEPWALVVLCGFVLVVIILFVLFMGPARVRAWIARQCQ
jgi:uncharacterized protein (TIGR02594 family)